MFVDGGVVNAVNDPVFGSSLQFNAGSSLHDATFHVASGANVVFNSNAANAVSGTITATGPGQVVINGNSSFVLASDTVFNFAAGVLQFQNNAAIEGPGTLTNVGFVQGTPVLKTKVLNTGTFAPTGTLIFSGASAELRILAGGTMGSTGINLGGDATSKGLIVESGGLLTGGFASGAVPVQVLGGTIKTVASASMAFSGTTSLVGALLDTSAGNQIFFQSGSTTTFSGTITGTGPAGTAVFANGPATFNVAAGGATLDFAPGMAVFHDATINGPGVLTTVGEMLISAINPILRTELRIEGTLNLVGTNPNLTLDGAGGLLRIADGGLFYGSSNVNGHGIGASNGGAGVLIEHGGIFQSAGDLTITAPFDNQGTALVDNVLRLNGPIAQISGTAGNITLTGGTWIQHGNSYLDFLNTSINTLGPGADVTVGSGNQRFPPITSLAGNAGTLRLIEGQSLVTSDFMNSGHIVLDAGTTLTVRNFTQSAAGVVEFGISGAGAGQQGQLIGEVAAVLAGTARVSITGGFAPAVGQSFPLMSFLSHTGTFTKVEGLNVGHVNIFEPVYTATTFSLNSLVSAADLDVTTITIPGASVAGNDVSFSYSVTNVSAFATPIAAWTDTVYLSKDGTLDAGDIVLTRVAHNGTLGANGTYTANVTVPLVGALPDNYRLIVVADSPGFVADTNRANNTLASTGAFALDVNALTPGVAFNGSIANNRDQYFKVTLPAGQTPTFTFTGAVAGEAEIYESLGEVPTRASFDESTFTAGSTVQRVAGEATAAATYYVLVHGRESAGAGQNFSLLASGIGFDLASTSVAHGANIGQVTTTLTGSQFSPATTFTLVPSSGPSKQATAVYFHDSQSADATFDLTGLAAGSYSIVASNGGPTGTLANAFTITNGGFAGTLQYNLSVPSYMRPPFVGVTATLTYENIGDTDLAAPLFTLFSDNARIHLAGQTDFFVGALELLGVSGGLAGVLSPGEKATIEVIFEPINTNVHATSTFEVFVADYDPAPLDFTPLKASLKPTQLANDAWDAIFTNFQAGAGTTLGSYKAMLVDNANYLGQFGAVSPEVTRLVDFELAQAGDFGAIADHYLLGALGRGNVAPFSLHATGDASGNVVVGDGISTRFFVKNSDGTFAGTGVDGGTLTNAAGVVTLAEATGGKTVFRASDGRIDFIEDTNGNRVTAAWNAGGQLLTATDSLTGDVTTFTHNAQGRIATITDAVGRVTTYGYDAGGEHLTSIATPRGTATLTYTPTGHEIASITDASGVVSTFTYDALGHRTQQTVGTGPGAVTTTYAYDSAGKLTITDSASHASQIFRVNNGLVARLVDAQGHFSNSTFDSVGRLLSVTDSSGVSTKTILGADGILDGFSTPGRAQTSLDISGDIRRLQSATDPGGDTTQFHYDAKGNLTSTLLPDGFGDTFEHDSKGRVIAATNANGERVTFTYNAASLISQRTMSDGSTTTFTYDAHRNMLTATDAEGATTFTYDAADRVTGTAYPNGKSVATTYDSLGRRATIADQSGYTVRYSYDALGRLDEVRDTGNNLLVNYDYNALGQLTAETRGNGSTTAFTYTATGLVATITHRDAVNVITGFFNYTYDALNHATTIVTEDGTTTNTYDLDGQITKTTLPGGRTIAYTYDAEGNRITVADSANGTENYTTNNVDEYTTAGAETLTYDHAGRIVARTVAGVTTSYTYDAAGHLAGIFTPGSVVTFDYDALGNRIGKTENGVRTDFAIDPAGLGTVFGEYQGAATVANYASGLGIAARAAGGSTAFYHFDATGNTSLISGAAGAAVATYDYLPFGKIAAQTGTLAQPFTFNGELGVQDDAGDLFYMRARTYDAKLGRFTSLDPIGFTGGDTNLYRFANNDPVNFIDPSGLFLSPLQILAYEYETGGYALGETATYLASLYSESQAAAIVAEAGQISTFLAQDFAAGLAVTGSTLLTTTAGFVAVALTPLATVVGFEHIDNYFRNNRDALATGLGYPVPNELHFTPDFIKKNADNVLFNVYYKMAIIEGKPPQDAILEAKVKVKQAENEAYRKTHPPGGAGAPAGVTMGATIVARPGDPNNIIGPSGAGADALPDTIAPGQTRFDGFVGASAIFPYKIEFENKPTANAPAQVVHVTQTLDIDLNFSTFAFTGFGFGANHVDVPANANGTSFHTIYDATATLGVKVKIDAELNTLTGALDVTYTSLDPATNDVPFDPLAGFLPPEDGSGKGDGFLTYSVQPKAGLANATAFTALASIVFDTEAAVATPTVTNTLDTLAPTSAINALPASTARTTFVVRFTGADDVGGSGLAGITLSYTDNGGPLLTATVANTDGSLRFTGAAGHMYAFYSQAVDHVGNTETLAATPDASISVVAPTFIDIGKKKTFTDADGDKFTVKYTGPGTAKVALVDPDGDGKGAIDFLQIDGSTKKSGVTVSVKKAAGGDGVVTIGDVTINGALAAFTAKQSDLVVNGLTASGAVKSISVSGVLRPDPILADPLVQLGGTAAAKTKLAAHTIADGFTLQTPGALTSLKAASIGTGTITAASIGAVKVTAGSLDADLATPGAIASITINGGGLTGALTAASFGPVQISGGDLSGSLTSLGDPAAVALASLTISGGDLTGDIRLLGALGPVSVGKKAGAGGNIVGATINAAKIAALTVAKDFRDSLVLAGADLGSDHALGGADDAADVFAAGQIGKVRINGSVIAGIIGAGLASTDAVFKNADDSILGGTASAVASLIVKGQADAASYFAAGLFAKAPTIAGTVVDPATDPRFLVA